MAFHEVRFPANLSLGSVGGPERRSEIVTLASGFEERNSPWAHSRRRYDAGLGLRSMDDIQALLAFFEARAGQLHGFRWKDWSDYTSGKPSAAPRSDDQIIGHGDGQRDSFPLLKAYVSGTTRYERPITKPVLDSVRVGLGGVEIFAGNGHAVDHATGMLRFDTPPAAGVEITAGFEFDVPVRFDTDRIAVSIASFQAGDLPQVPVVEIRI